MLQFAFQGVPEASEPGATLSKSGLNHLFPNVQRFKYFHINNVSIISTSVKYVLHIFIFPNTEFSDSVQVQDCLVPVPNHSSAIYQEAT